ncbi:hypothetical protein [Cupriavidus basilensis]|uniref:Uncharacterized protein n=1 Tax=Cupriavidus basilensis TaxID=68895 RepID=A0A643FSI9_9BURK|nr:hypothetical protein [Cupriavidus basilensis]QOT82206.1 hypothetical protein F7R26_039535 [Cupriavidus basilensis]
MDKPNNEFTISEGCEYLTVKAEKATHIIPVLEVKGIRAERAAGSHIYWWQLVIDTSQGRVVLKAFGGSRADADEKGREEVDKAAKELADRLYAR